MEFTHSRQIYRRLRCTWHCMCSCSGSALIFFVLWLRCFFMVGVADLSTKPRICSNLAACVLDQVVICHCFVLRLLRFFMVVGLDTKLRICNDLGIWINITSSFDGLPQSLKQKLKRCFPLKHVYFWIQTLYPSHITNASALAKQRDAHAVSRSVNVCPMSDHEIVCSRVRVLPTLLFRWVVVLRPKPR